MALSTLSSSSSSQNGVSGVFVSFSGKDVRKNFLSHLYKELDRHPIIYFKDNEIKRGLSLGPELKQEIKNSRIAIVIFSINYASSNWCLNELLEIVKSKERFKQVVIPIFYSLDPTHVRKQIGVFGNNFKRTCRNKREDEKLRYKKALTDVANITGYDSSKTCENDSKMIEAIIDDILRVLATTKSKDFEDFVGIEKPIGDLKILLDSKAHDAIMLGICGPSGSGKTTIARVLFYELSGCFRLKIFVDGAFISKSTQHYSRANNYDYNMRLHLQQKFLSKLLEKGSIKVTHLGAVRESLKKHKVLIFIDDLKDQFVLDTLVGHTDWFGRGSRIIVITKYRNLIESHGIGSIYEVCLPSDDHALQILCRYAFNQNYPPDDFLDVAYETALSAGKLPLVLKGLGSHLRERDKKYWMELLLCFRKGQYSEIVDILKLNYHGLNNKNDEAVFRRIAFLNGGEAEDIKSLLADSDLDVDTGIKNLADKSLIQVTSNIVEMHSLIQEMGKEINRTQSKEPGKREFLEDAKEVRSVLTDNTGTASVIGISFDVSGIDGLNIHKSAFKEMHNLQFLRISSKENKAVGLNFSEDYDFLPHKLRLLEWNQYPLKSMPSPFSENLVELVMIESRLEKLWDGVQVLPYLKIINMWGSQNLKNIPDLSMATNLRSLNFGNCSSLVELPSSIRNLNKLKRLNLSLCNNLETLPTSINLQALDSLDLFKCSKLRSFPDISTNISELDLSETGIEEVPRSIENFTKLKVINMWHCEKLKSVSVNISKLQHLEIFDFSDCDELIVANLNNGSTAARMAVNAKVFSSLPKVELNFINCSNLDKEALLQQQSFFKRLILSAEEVPSYFTQRTTDTSLTNIPLLETSLSQPFFRFMACAVVGFESISIEDHCPYLIEVSCQFKDGLGKHFGSAQWPMYFSTSLLTLSSHLVIFDCSLPLNGDYAYLGKRHYDHVDIQFRLTDDDSLFKLKGCGIRLYEDGTPSLGTFPHAWKADEINKESETSGQVSRDREEEANQGLYVKRMRKTEKILRRRVKRFRRSP